MLDKKVTHIFSTPENTLSLIMEYCDSQCHEDTGDYLQITMETADEAKSLVFISYRGQAFDMVSNSAVVIERGKTYSDEDKAGKRSQVLTKLSEMLGMPEGPVESTYVKYLDFLVSGECAVSIIPIGVAVGTEHYTALIVSHEQLVSLRSFNERMLSE